ncbi:MAG TPA: hypothetical protein EYO39_07085 [Nitrospirales bacterium]|nr:hypothetical protein [Nitrospirales bacterium]
MLNNPPLKRTKANRRHVVPVTSLGIDVIENVPSTCGTHLFSSSFGANPISNYGDAKLELVQMTQLENFRLHDLRDTVGTVMRERLGISSDVIGQVLNHAPEGVTQKHYCPSHSPKDKRKALMKWDRYLDNLVHETKADNIIQFPGVG